jgi:hypothetical protein
VEGQERGRTAPGPQPDIPGNKTGLAPGLDENRRRLRPEDGDRRIRAMNLPMSEQGDSAFVVLVRGVRMDQGVQPGENHHRLKQQEDTEPQDRVGLFGFPVQNP